MSSVENVGGGPFQQISLHSKNTNVILRGLQTIKQLRDI